MNGQFSKFDRPYHLDPASTQAMQGEIKLLKTQLDYLENGNRRLHYSYEARNQDLQDKLDTCQNQNEAIFGLRSSNQVCEGKIEGIDHKYFQLSVKLDIIYRGPHMSAILVMMGTKYACNLDYKGDQTCLQCQSR